MPVLKTSYELARERIIASDYAKELQQQENKKRIELVAGKIGMPSHQNIKYNFMPRNFADIQTLIRIVERAFGTKKRKKYDAIFTDNKKQASFLRMFYPVHTTEVILMPEAETVEGIRRAIENIRNSRAICRV